MRSREFTADTLTVPGHWRLLGGFFAALLAALAGALFMSLGGCKSAPPPPAPTIVKLSVEALAGVNPSASGRPSPIVVRIYELKSRAAFDHADFFTLWGHDQTALDDEKNGAKIEYTLRPGDHQSVDQPVQPGTKFIGVVAGYLNLEGSRWRAVADVPPNKTTPLAVRLDAADVTIGPP